ncbi:MAG TPA: peptidase domain-containing ABC transporter [Oscillatoriales cyanobacterium M59_W2019_021]|nr:MAG: type I secretion system permease/ATPase [Cyanobacteria bacterium J055]HIK33922.1 peptidase domain-containing ABC transporter [Oscillatoriales cyanobacterium M4454_W2019_049]HIK51437.1 peptidase domain-containing ABC transporter [Oscillatoriales cyanobacterium M59_W2019_021]
MTQTSPEIQIVEFLTRVSPFDRLGERQLQKLAANSQLLRYRVGQQILVRDKMPAQVSVIYEGQVRLLGYDHRSQKSVSLQVVGLGEMLGWLGLVRDTACETAIASTETICLTIPAADFLAAMEAQPDFASAVRDRVSIVEVFELLSLELDRRADAGSNLKELAFQMWPEAHLVHLPPGGVKQTQLDSDRLWLVSRGPVGEHPTGARMLSPYLPTWVKQEVRLVGVAWPAPILADEPRSLTDPWEETDGHREKGAIVPIESAPLVPPEPPIDPLAPPPKYPYVKGFGVPGAALACFHMLSKHLRINFRRDAIRKLLEQQVKSRGEITLYGCGTIMPALGMNAQLAKVPSNLVGRLKAPAMIKWQQSYAVLYNITEKEIVLAVPEVGILHQTPEQIAEASGEVLEILLLQPPTEKAEKFDIWWFVPSLARYKKVLTEVFVASFFVQLFGLANPLLTQVVIDKVLGQRSIETLNVLGVFMILVALFEGLLTSLRTYLFVDTTNRIDLDLGSKVIDHLFRLPLKYFDTRRVGDIAGRVNELANIRQFITGTALTVVLNALFSVIYIAVMLTYSIVLTFVALATVPFFTALILFVSPIVQRLLRKRAERYADAQSYLVETLNGIQTVKAQNIELTSRWNWYERYARFMNAGFRTTLTNTAASSIAGFLNKLSGLLLLWVGAYMVLENKLTLGQLIAFRIIAGNVTGALLQFVQVWQSFQEVGMSIERLRDILNSEPESDDSDRLNIPLPSINGEVEFDEVCFRFNPTGPLQVSNVNLHFPAGTFVGVVGESGSGKSTTMKLLQRLYPPTSGRILIDGFDISKVELYSLRRQIGVVLQDTLLFNNTIKANIALNNPEATDEEIIDAAKVAAAHEFIMTLQNGYNTVVGERGSSLSGGQRQRIAIARTVLQRPRLLILDEATSALDYNLESLVCRNLIEEFKGRTVFFITHRLPTVQQADTIIMMDKGSLVEQGTHDELMALKGRYYCLYQQQESQL